MDKRRTLILDALYDALRRYQAGDFKDGGAIHIGSLPADLSHVYLAVVGAFATTDGSQS